MLLRSAMRLLPRVLGTHGKSRLSILIFHRVLPEHDPLRPDEPVIDEFDWRMRILREYFTPLPLLEAVDRLRSGDLPERAVCVTFDDGYSDNEKFALPILKKYGIPATVFVSTGFLNGGRMWNDTVIEVVRRHRSQALDLQEFGLGSFPLTGNAQRLAAIAGIIQQIKHLDPLARGALTAQMEPLVPDLPTDLMMTDDQIHSLVRSGVTVGAHTVNHPILASISEEVARQEITASKRYLESLIQAPVDAFAYPNGRPDADYRTVHRDLVNDLGFKAAVSTHWGVSTSESDCLQLPRFTPWDRQPIKFSVRLLASYRWIDPLVSSRH